MVKLQKKNNEMQNPSSKTILAYDLFSIKITENI